jgi:hypothetical protein
MANGIWTKMMRKVLCQKNCANGLRTAIKTHELYLCIKERGNVLSLHRLCHWHCMCSRRQKWCSSPCWNQKPHWPSKKTFINSPNMTNSKIDLRKAVTKSETIMCQLIVNLNLPLSTADTFTKCFKQMFTDSKIVWPSSLSHPGPCLQ